MGLRLLSAYGQAPLGREGSGAFRRPGSMVRVLCTGPWVQPTERAGSEGSLICRLRRQENHTTALRASENRPTSLRSRKCIPPFGGWRHHLPAPLGSVSLDSQSPTALCESSSLATTSWWDYGCLTMGRSLYRKAWSSLFCPPDGVAREHDS